MAKARVARGESYVAGAAALNAMVGAARLSHDVDLFHDTAEAVAESWTVDRALLEEHGCEVTPLREREGYVEALVRRDSASLLLQWTRDSAFRFFPLVEHEDFGLALHPFDLATNKVLALVGRLEVRDWVDVLTCHERIQPLGYLAWAACGKDPGFSPQTIIEQAGRATRYSAREVDALSFEGLPPDAGDLARRWHAMLDQARAVVAVLPPEQAGKCVLDEHATLFSGNATAAAAARVDGTLRFHEGRIRGAWPQVR
ncbi:MAG: hypothetical protein V1774_03925 [Candidatus Eisenbacteria bacterium]